MARTRFHGLTLAGATLAPLALAGAAPAQQPIPVGGEFQVNSYTTSYQFGSSVATAANGDFVVVWKSYGSYVTDTHSVQGQRYASDGSAQGGQFQVNTYTSGAPRSPSVKAAVDGDFVVVWQSYGSAGTDTSNRSIQGQRYASDGSAQGGQFQVNTYTTSGQYLPSVAVAADGDFVVVWYSAGSFGTDTSSFSVQGQRYASDGATQGPQFQVNTYTTSAQGVPSVSAEADGGFVVVWTSNGSSGTDTSEVSIQGQRYASNGSAEGAQFQVNSYTTSYQLYPSVATGADGGFVVVWWSVGSSGTDTDSYSIQGQRFASDGSMRDTQFQVNTYTTSRQADPFVAVAVDGDFVVVWNSDGSFGTDTSISSVQGQRYASNGSAQGAQFQVNTYTTAFQGSYRSVVAAADGNLVVVWPSSGSSGTDTSSSSIQGQRYSLAAPAPPVRSMSTETRFALAALLLLGAGYAMRRRG
jgi:hypothetical protein